MWTEFSDIYPMKRFLYYGQIDSSVFVSDISIIVLEIENVRTDVQPIGNGQGCYFFY